MYTYIWIVKQGERGVYPTNTPDEIARASKAMDEAGIDELPVYALPSDGDYANAVETNEVLLCASEMAEIDRIMKENEKEGYLSPEESERFMESMLNGSDDGG